MAMQGVSSYTNAYGMYAGLFTNNAESAGVGHGDNSASGAAGTARLSGLLTPEGRKELEKALENMRALGYDKMSFEAVETYRKDLEKNFTFAIKSDLAAMGVDPDIEFTLVMDAYGAIKVISSHPDKAIIELYLADNPEMIETFKHIQALSNLRRSQQKAAQNNEFARNVKHSLRAEAIQAFFAATDNNGKDYFSQIATFGNNNAATWMLGLNLSV